MSRKVTPPAKSDIPFEVNIELNIDDAPRQTTLTQHFGGNNDEESSVEEMLTPSPTLKRRKTTETQGRITVKTSQKFDGKLFEIGDLVMATAGDINHPACDDNSISTSYIFVGCVTGWRERKWACGLSSDFDHVFVNWMNIEVNGMRYQDYKDGNPLYDDNCRLFNIFVNYDFVHGSKLNILAGTAESKVGKVNEFLEELIYENFCHGSKRGWRKILPVG